MVLSIEEQEICMNGMRDEPFFTLYSSDRIWIKKMDKLVKESPDLFEVIAETSYGKTYKFPKQLLHIRSKIIKRNFSEEQKRLASERLKKAREHKLNI